METVRVALMMLALSLPMSLYAAGPGNGLTGKEIKQLVAGNTVEGHFMKPSRNVMRTTSVQFNTYFSSDGQVVEKSVAMGAGAAGHVPAHGTWKARKGKLCIQFRDAEKNDERCRRVVPTGGGGYELFTGKGRLTRTWDRVVPGNSHGLVIVPE